MTVQVRIHPEVAAVIDDIVAAIHKEFGELVERIVLLGSSIRCDFRPGESDVDIVVLVSQFPPDYDFSKMSAFEESIKTLHPRAECHVTKRDKIERWRNFELCYEGQVARGHVLYDAKKPFDGIVLSREEAKEEVIQSYFTQASFWTRLATARLQDCKKPSLAGRRISLDLVWECCRATCRVLHAVLTKHEIDFIQKPPRWNLTALFERAVSLEPSLREIDSHIKGLPQNLASLDLIDVDGIDQDASVVDLRAASVRTLLCIRAAGRCLGIPLRMHSIKTRLATGE